jgi:hypothetical protein
MSPLFSLKINVTVTAMSVVPTYGCEWHQVVERAEKIAAAILRDISGCA